jgi:hypothetical protein
LRACHPEAGVKSTHAPPGVRSFGNLRCPADFAFQIPEKRNLATLSVLIQYSYNSFGRHVNHLPNLARIAQCLYVPSRNSFSLGTAE